MGGGALPTARGYCLWSVETTPLFEDGDDELTEGVAIGCTVARLSILGLNAAVTAVSRPSAGRGADAWAIGGRQSHVRCAEVALFTGVLGPVTSVGGERTVGSTSPVTAVVDAVVTLFTGVFEAIAALLPAVGIAGTRDGSIENTVVALLGRQGCAVTARDQRNKG